MRHAWAALLAAGVLLGGCASAREMAPIGAVMASTGLFANPEERARLEKRMTDRDIAEMLDVKVQAKLPTNLAVAKLASHCSGYQPYLSAVDSEELAAWEKVVDGQPSIRAVRPISHLAMGGSSLDLHALREAAARQDCELLLVYVQADSSVDNWNDAAVLYWSIVGLWVVPGNVVEHRTVFQAALVDCRTGMILGTATGSRQDKRLCPAAFADIRQTDLARECPKAALADLQENSRAMLGSVINAALASARQ